MKYFFVARDNGYAYEFTHSRKKSYIHISRAQISSHKCDACPIFVNSIFFFIDANWSNKRTYIHILVVFYRILWILPENTVLQNGSPATPEIQLHCDHADRTYSQVSILCELLSSARQFEKSRGIQSSELNASRSEHFPSNSQNCVQTRITIITSIYPDAK